MSDADLIPEWPRLVGAQIAHVATPVAILCDEVLVVRAKKSWIPDLQAMSSQIVRGINAIRTDAPPFRRLQLLADRTTAAAIRPVPTRPRSA